MQKNKEILIRCPECKVPFIKLLPTRNSMKFVKLIDGSHKEVKIILRGSVETIICPKCGNTFNVKKLIVDS